MQKLSTTSNSNESHVYAEISSVPIGTEFYIGDIIIQHSSGISSIKLDKRCLNNNRKIVHSTALTLLPSEYYSANIKTLFPHLLPETAGVITVPEMKILEQLYSDGDQHQVIMKTYELPELNSISYKLMAFNPDAIRNKLLEILHTYQDKLYKIIEDTNRISNKLTLTELNS